MSSRNGKFGCQCGRDGRTRYGESQSDAGTPPLGVATSFASLKSISTSGARRCERLLRLTFLALLTVTLPVTSARAGSRDVRFDTAYLVSCRDVTTDDFAEANPQDRLVEARVWISALADNGDLPDAEQFVYRMFSPSGNLRIVDYQPQSEQTTSVAGNVSIEKSKEKNKSLGLSVSGSFEQIVRGTAGTDIGSKDSSKIRYELKPPMEVVLVAGTVNRGTGVYFKLRPSPTMGLEGSREFVITMRVSQAWRGDLFYIRCEAQQERRGEFVPRGVSRFVVGLYAEGDRDAQRIAENLVRAESRLRRSVAQRQRDIRRRATPTVVHKVGAMLDMYDPRIPDLWLDHLVFGSANLERHEFVRHLPDDVRRMADSYCRAKRKLFAISGGRLAMAPALHELSAR